MSSRRGRRLIVGVVSAIVAATGRRPATGGDGDAAEASSGRSAAEASVTA